MAAILNSTSNRVRPGYEIQIDRDEMTYKGHRRKVTEHLIAGSRETPSLFNNFIAE